MPTPDKKIDKLPFEAEQGKESLRVSESAPLNIINSAPSGTVITDHAAFIKWLNPTFSTLTGYSLNATVEYRPIEIVKSCIQDDAFYEAMWQEIRGGQHWRGEMLYQRKDGGFYHEELNVYPVEDETGKIIHYFGFKQDISERKQMEAALRQSEQKFRALFEFSRDAIMMINLEGIFVGCNPATLAMFGCRHEQELLGLTPVDTSPEFQPDGGRSDQKQRELMAQIMEQDSLFFEWLHCRKDGAEFMSEVLVTRMEVCGQTQFQAVVRDISERKKLKQNLREKEWVLSESQRMAHVGSWIMDLVTGCTNWSDETYRVYGVTPETFVPSANTLIDLIHPEDRVLMEMWINDCIAGKQPPELDFRIMLADGSVRFIAGRGGLQCDEQQRPLRITGVVQDITERKLIVEEMRLSENKLRALYEFTHDAIMLLDESGFFDCNQATLELFGCATKDEFYTKHPVDLSPNVQPCGTNSMVLANQKIALALSEGHQRFEWVHKRADTGAIFPVDVLLSSMPLEGGRVLQAVVRDISERKEMDRLILSKNHELEQATLTKSTFLSNMSHEIRTPMNAILGMSYLMMQTELTPRQFNYNNKVMDSTRRLLGIVNDILDFSKIEAGKLTVEFTGFELEKILKNVSNLIVEKAGAKGLELILDVDKNVPLDLIGDPLRFEQILINYCSNAIKFTERGEISIHLRVKEQLDKEVLIHCAVRDTGIGLTEEQRGQLFQSFSQTDASTTRKFGGSGLGLAIAKNLAGLMGGEVGVDSEFGKGSTFWFTVRLGIGMQRKLILPDNLRGKRMLVVDHNETSRLVLGKLLGDMSFSADMIATGAATIDAVVRAAAENSPYEIVFLDWRRKGIDCTETARQLKALPLSQTPHIVAVAAYDCDEAIRDAAETSYTDVLIKPVTASVLFNAIVCILSEEDVDAHPMVSNDTFELLATIKGARILLVEDNDINQEVAIEILRDAGFVVDLAENGQIALNKVRAADYDIVLMDIQMPVMDGLTATVEIRKEERFRDLPVVAMTANAMQSDRDGCMAAGMNDHIAKPIEPEDLWTILLKWIKPRHPKSAVAVIKPKVAQDTDLPSSVVGLNIDKGLHRALGKKSLYLSLLRKFVAGQKFVAEKIRKALEGNDRSTAERLAHTLKGVTGNIGATRLQPLAAQLESAIKARHPHEIIDTRLIELKKQLENLTTQLEQQLPKERARIEVMIAPKKLKAVCDELEALLNSDNAEACEVLSENADLLYSAFPAHYSNIEGNVRSFDFDAALLALSAALQTFPFDKES